MWMMSLCMVLSLSFLVVVISSCLVLVMCLVFVVIW